MTITNLNIFQPGTIASSTTMNENFETVRTAINSTEQTVISNKTYLDNKITEINSSIQNSIKTSKKEGSVFCINSGAYNAGKPEILKISGTTLSFTTPFVGTNINGDMINPTDINSISISGYADGTYNVFVDLDGEIEILSNTIYNQATEPTNTINTIWLDTSVVPINAKIYTVEGWKDFLKIPIGYFTLTGGNVSEIVTNDYNQNGYSVNTSGYYPMPDFKSAVNKTNGVTYTAETNGWIYAYAYVHATDATHKITINGFGYIVSYGKFAGVNNASGSIAFIPITKGSTYVGTGLSAYVFYSTKKC